METFTSGWICKRMALVDWEGMRQIIRDLWGIEDGEVRMQNRSNDGNRNSSFSEKSSVDGRHRCYIDGSSAACFEESGELWVKEYANGSQRECRTYKVNFCPQCGYKKPSIVSIKKSYQAVSGFGDQGDIISKFSASLGEAVAQMNHNIAIIKANMSAQSTQNSCFIEREMEFAREIEKIKTEIKSIK